MSIEDVIASVAVRYLKACDGASDVPGRLSYIVAKDPADADAIWITEIWTDRDTHCASLQLPAATAGA